MFRYRLVRLKRGQNVDESKKVHLEIGLAHRPLHEEAVEVAGIKKGWIRVSKVSKDLPTEVYDRGVE